MPYDDPDMTDPMTLHGVGVETGDEMAMINMAACFIEEYARLGFGEYRIMRLFQTQGYAGPALAYRVLGHERIQCMVAEEMRKWGPDVRHREPFTRTPAGCSLPVLE